MEIIKNIVYTLWVFVPFYLIFITLIVYTRYQQPKVYRIKSSGWLDIKNYPIPEDIEGFLATDGKKVDYKYNIQWGPYGNVIFRKSYSNDKISYITHWQPLPDLPERK